MSYDQLYWFSRQVVQVVWGEFVAAESPDALAHPDDPDEWVGEHALAGLFAFDSSFWLVGGPEHVIERVAARFEHAEHLDPADGSATHADHPDATVFGGRRSPHAG